MTIEYLNEVNEEGQIVKRGIPRDLAHLKGILHEVGALLLWDRENDEILLSRRSRNKSMYSGFWEVSCSGHIASDEEIDCLVREVREELGLDIDMKNLEYRGSLRYDFEFMIDDTKLSVRELVRLSTNLTPITAEYLIPNYEEIDLLGGFSRTEAIKLLNKDIDSIEGYNILKDNERIKINFSSLLPAKSNFYLSLRDILIDLPSAIK